MKQACRNNKITHQTSSSSKKNWIHIKIEKMKKSTLLQNYLFDESKRFIKVFVAYQPFWAKFDVAEVWIQLSLVHERRNVNPIMQS